MATGRVWNPGWLDENSQRNYPLAEGATRWDTSGTMQLPNDLLVDAVISVPYSTSLDITLFHIQSINVFAQGLTLTIGYNGTSFATITVDKTVFTPQTTYAFVGQAGDFQDVAGKITIGSLTNLSTATAGALVFTPAATRFETRVLRPNIRGVTSLAVQNGTELSNPISGPVILAAGQNIRLMMDETNNTIRIDALQTANLATACSCDEVTTLGQPITTINGVAPDNTGNINLVGSDCLTITASGQNALNLQDNCAKPCCGCSELDVIATDLASLGSQIKTMDAFSQRLSAMIMNLQTNVMTNRAGNPS